MNRYLQKLVKSCNGIEEIFIVLPSLGMTMSRRHKHDMIWIINLVRIDQEFFHVLKSLVISYYNTKKIVCVN